MRSMLLRCALPLLLVGAGLATSASAQTYYGRPADRDITTGSVGDAPGGMMYETDGNAKTPRAIENPSVPAWQRGAGQTTGGSARALIPSSRW